MEFTIKTVLFEIEQYKKFEKELTDGSGENKMYLKERMAVCRNNANFSLRAYAAPIIRETLRRYKGKKIGEKTIKKISDELESTIGLKTFCYTSSFSKCFSIRVSTDVRQIEMETYIGKNNPYYFEGNVFLGVEDSFADNDSSAFFVADPDAYIQKKERELDALRVMQQHFEDAIKTYNSDALSTIEWYRERIPEHKTIFE